ncbi:MAG: ABC transporter substrate-binding protein [Thermomicrobiales bacterium]
MASAQETLLSKQVSRRKLLGTGAGLTAAMYAGGVMPGGLGKTVMAQDGGTEFHSAWPYLDLGSGGHFNNFVTNGIMNPPNIYGDLMFVPMGLQYWSDWEWLPLLATEWSFSASGAAAAGTPAASPDASPMASPVADGIDTFNVTLREGVMWSDGAAVTTADVVATFDILWLTSNTVWSYIDTVTAVDDLNISFHMSTPSTVVERYIIRRSPLPAAVYGEFASQANALRTGGMDSEAPEFLQLLDQFNAFRPEAPVVNGPYTIDPATITNAQFDMPKNTTSYWADMAKFDKIVNFNGETDTISAVVLSKEIDYATQGFAPATELEFAAQGIRVLRPPTYGGAALLFNFATLPEFADKRVRQALAYAIDRAQVGFVSLAESGVPVNYMAGISDNLVPTWVREDAIAGLNTYALDPAGAEALMIEAGWTKDGTWSKPDGTEAAYELMWPAEFADYSATGANVVEQLNAFGFNVTGRPITFTQIGIDIDMGNFQLAIQGWGSSSNPHPRFSYETAFFVHNTLAINNGGEGMAFPLDQETDVAGMVDLESLTRDSALGMDEGLQLDQVTTIAQVFNELLNIIPLYERFGNNSALEGVRVASWPADDDPILLNSPYADGIPTILILTGLLEPFAG